MKYVSRTISTCAVALAMLCASTVSLAHEEKDIVDTAVAAGSFKTLATALGAANLVDALKGDGPFTVFAPTDEAFAKLPAGTVESLVKAENRDQLTAILTYHVVSGKVKAKDVVKLAGAKTLNGQRVDITVSGEGVEVDKANVVTTDIVCSNGVIHVIDSVLLPSTSDIAETAEKAGSFKTLLAAAAAAGLVEPLKGKGPLTVFAPTDEAFAKLPAGTVESLLKPESKGKLAEILKYHVVSGRVYSEDALAAKQAKTLQGSQVKISVQSGAAKVNDATLVATDIDASNGVIHVIDKVILPPEGKVLGAADGRRMIEHAIARGAHMYNTGDHAGCAHLYMSTMNEMIQFGGKMPESVVAHMRNVVAEAEHSASATHRAWTLRYGLDNAYAQMR